MKGFVLGAAAVVVLRWAVRQIGGIVERRRLDSAIRDSNARYGLPAFWHTSADRRTPDEIWDDVMARRESLSGVSPTLGPRENWRHDDPGPIVTEPAISGGWPLPSNPHRGGR